MKQPALYTKDTISRIRQMAGANTSGQIGAALGWPRLRVEKLAKLHGIDVTPGDQPTVVRAPTPVPAPIVGRPVKRSPLPFARNGLVFGDIKWAPIISEVERGGRLAALPRNQNLVFGVLIRELAAGHTGMLLAGWIEQQCGLGIAVSTVVQGLRQRLAPLHMEIEARKGRGGGFRLVVSPWPEKPAHPMPAERMA